MGIAEPIRRYTSAEYYALEAEADERSEYFDGEIFVVSGGSARHSMIGGNIIRHLGNQLLGTPCNPFGPDLKLKVKATGLRTYPDVSVYCGKREVDPEDPAAQTYMNPTMVVEVLSPTTETYDRGKKALYYRRVESLQILLLVSQEMPRVETHTRQLDGSWSLREHDGMGTVLRLEAIGTELPLAEIYRGVEVDNLSPWEHPIQSVSTRPPSITRLKGRRNTKAIIITVKSFRVEKSARMVCSSRWPGAAYDIA